MTEIGYKDIKLHTKIRILKNLLEAQFDNNWRFKLDVINNRSAASLRFLPIGKDGSGLTYWYLIDSELNLRIYRDNEADEESGLWELICCNRFELAALIKLLERDLKNVIEKQNTPVIPAAPEKSSTADSKAADATKNGPIPGPQEQSESSESGNVQQTDGLREKSETSEVISEKGQPTAESTTNCNSIDSPCEKGVPSPYDDTSKKENMEMMCEKGNENGATMDNKEKNDGIDSKASTSTNHDELDREMVKITDPNEIGTSKLEHQTGDGDELPMSTPEDQAGLDGEIVKSVEEQTPKSENQAGLDEIVKEDEVQTAISEQHARLDGNEVGDRDVVEMDVGDKLQTAKSENQTLLETAVGKNDLDFGLGRNCKSGKELQTSTSEDQVLHEGETVKSDVCDEIQASKSENQVELVDEMIIDSASDEVQCSKSVNQAEPDTAVVKNGLGHELQTSEDQEGKIMKGDVCDKEKTAKSEHQASDVVENIGDCDEMQTSKSENQADLDGGVKSDEIQTINSENQTEFDGEIDKSNVCNENELQPAMSENRVGPDYDGKTDVCNKIQASKSENILVNEDETSKSENTVGCESIPDPVEELVSEMVEAVCQCEERAKRRKSSSSADHKYAEKTEKLVKNGKLLEKDEEKSSKDGQLHNYKHLVENKKSEDNPCPDQHVIIAQSEKETETVIIIDDEDDDEVSVSKQKPKKSRQRCAGNSNKIPISPKSLLCDADRQNGVLVLSDDDDDDVLKKSRARRRYDPIRQQKRQVKKWKKLVEKIEAGDTTVTFANGKWLYSISSSGSSCSGGSSDESSVADSEIVISSSSSEEEMEAEYVGMPVYDRNEELFYDDMPSGKNARRIAALIAPKVKDVPPVKTAAIIVISDSEEEGDEEGDEESHVAKDNLPEEELLPDSKFPCCVCLSYKKADSLLLCDECNIGYHMECLHPLLLLVPRHDWFCPPCDQKQLIEKLKVNLLLLRRRMKLL